MIYMAAEAGILSRHFHEGQWTKSQSTGKDHIHFYSKGQN
jgi:hypothetical protein